MRIPVRISKALRAARGRLPRGLAQLSVRLTPTDERSQVRLFNRLIRERRFGAMGHDHEWFTAQLLERMRPGPGDRVLEVGCGDGWACRMGARRAPGATFWGMDISDAVLREGVTAAGPADSVGLAQASAEVLPFGTGAFTAVFCVESFFLFRNLERVLREVERVLVPGGRAFLVQCLYRENRGALPWIGFLDVPVHVRGVADYRALLVRCGWTEVEAVELHREGGPGSRPNAHDHALLLVGRKAGGPG